LLENKIKLRGDESKAIDEVLKKYGDEKKLDDDIKKIRDDEINAIKARYATKKEITDKEIKDDQTKRESFNTGWQTSFNQYKSDAENSALQVKTMFSAVTRGMEDLIVNFVQTGKLNFNDFANSIIAEFVRIQARKAIAGLFGGIDGGSSVFSTIFGGGKAAGGPVTGNTPYLVGENGPELFLPRTSGNIVPNNQLSSAMNTPTQVVYNINAVDAPSFRAMLAREPEFLYAVTQKGASSIPSARM
jgi:phage-related minor tail protein